MSAAAITPEAPALPGRPTWPQSVGAVLGGSIFAYVFSMVWLLPLWMLNLLPGAGEEGTSGHGWPWRIDGPWSLAADLGPLLLCGLAMAAGISLFTVKWTGVYPRVLPIVVVAAALGWVSVGVDGTGVLDAGGAVAFFAMVWVTREYSRRERRPLRWSRGQTLLVLAAGLGLTGATLTYGSTHPLSASGSSSSSFADGETRFTLFLNNDGPLDVRVIAIGSDDPFAVPQRLTPTKIASGAHGAFDVAIPSRHCIADSLDGVRVTLRVAGRTQTQLVRLPSDALLDCS